MDNRAKRLPFRSHLELMSDPNLALMLPLELMAQVTAVAAILILLRCVVNSATGVVLAHAAIVVGLIAAGIVGVVSPEAMVMFAVAPTLVYLVPSA